MLPRYLRTIFDVALFDVDLVQPNCVVTNWNWSYGFYVQLLLPVIYSSAYLAPLVVDLAKKLRRDGETTVAAALAALDHYEGDLGERFSDWIAHSLMILDVCHTTIAVKTLGVWRCVGDLDGRRFLIHAPEIRCGTANHAILRVFAGLYIAGVVLGFPLFTCAVLVKNKVEHAGLHVPHVLARYGWVYSRYRGMFLWDMWLTCRLLFLVCIAMAFNSGVVQVVLSVGLCVAATAIHARYMPFISKRINYMEFGFISLTLLFALVSLLTESLPRAHAPVLSYFMSLVFALVAVVTFKLNMEEVRELKASREALITVFEGVLEDPTQPKKRHSAIYDADYARVLKRIDSVASIKVGAADADHHDAAEVEEVEALRERHETLEELLATLDGHLCL